MKNTLGALSLAAALLVVVPANAASHKAKITPKQAKAVAVKAVPGTALSAKYEFEDGRWQYAVLVKNHQGQLYEVEVSPAGKVLDQEKTSAAEENSEAAADKKNGGQAGNQDGKAEAGETDAADNETAKSHK